MPCRDVIINIPGFTIKKVSGYDPIEYHLCYRKKVHCPHCKGADLRLKGSRLRLIKHEPIGMRRTRLHLSSRKFYCRCCGRYFYERFPGIRLYQRATERLKQYSFHHHTQGLSQRSLAQLLDTGHSTIERWYHEYYKRENQELRGRHCPRVLGIDEHSFSKRQGYATTFCDLEKHKIFDVVPGKSETSLRDYLLSLKGRERVRVICIDLSDSYRTILQKYFPNAKIVADRFHVIRLIQHHFLKTWQALEPHVKHQRGLLQLMRTNPTRLSDKQRKRLNQYLEDHPVIKEIYLFIQQLKQLLKIKRQTAKACQKLIPQLLQSIEILKHSGLKQLKTLALTLERWQEEIVRMWRFTKNNGITEGFHRKMKLIQRRAYGFRNFENYRLRVRVLCS